MIRHLVHLRFRADVTADQKAALYADLARLSDHIPGIVDFQHRENVSVETPLVRDFLDMFWFDFKDTSVRDTYLNDATHQAIGARIVDCLQGGAEGVFVCDITL
ncbi:MAG: Dabb family protein [Pelagimonas sp.]|jgi:hypothetical protein|nr:Dabb family protein [Pelagimonas sp.]